MSTFGQQDKLPGNGKMRLSNVIHKNQNRTDCSNYRGVSLVAHAGKVLLKIVASRLSNYCETEGSLPEEQCGFCPAQSTIDLLFVVRLLQELKQQRKAPLYGASSICRKLTTLSTESCCGRYSHDLAYQPKTLIIIRNLRESMLARVRTDDGENSE